MGQSSSSEKKPTTNSTADIISTQSNPGEGALHDIPSLKRKKSIQQVKQKLTRSELMALHHTFQYLKTTSSDHGDFIEPKRFLEHLHLPLSMEPAGILLFKSFSRLGAYPNCDLISAPIHLSWNSFLTAFAVLTGKLDDAKQDTTIFETAFFNSLAILPRLDSSSTTTTTTTTTVTTVTVTTTEEELDNHIDSAINDILPNEIVNRSSTNGYTLADLGIQFDDDDMAELEPDVLAVNPQDTLKILRNDLKELFNLALWIVHAEHAEHAEQRSTLPDINSIQQLADNLTNTIYDLDNHSTADNSSDDHDNGNCISHHAFCTWKSRNAPYLFKTIQSFIYTRFAMTMPKIILDDSNEDHDDTASLRTIDLVLSQDIAPLPSSTDILDTNCCALLSWSLPPMYLTTKQWKRLYSGDKDGFSMNRFESHVFKYPGPTLLVIQIQITHNNPGSKKMDILDDMKLTLAMLISEPWKQGKDYWGTDQTFLMELYPRFELFKSTGRNQQYVYCQQKIGLAFGGTTLHPPPRKLGVGDMAGDGCVLFLDNTLQTGRYYQEQYPVAPTFEKSQQHHELFDYGFDVRHLEVFGLGDEKLTLAQKKAWAFEYQDATRRAGVQIRQQDGQIDKEILKMAGIIQDDHHHHYEGNQPRNQQ